MCETTNLCVEIMNSKRQVNRPHVREFKTVLDSGFHTVDSGFQALDSSICHMNLDSGFLELYSGFHKQKFLGFWILQAKFSQIPESGFPYTGRK